MEYVINDVDGMARLGVTGVELRKWGLNSNTMLQSFNLWEELSSVIDKDKSVYVPDIYNEELMRGLVLLVRMFSPVQRRTLPVRVCANRSHKKNKLGYYLSIRTPLRYDVSPIPVAPLDVEGWDITPGTPTTKSVAYVIDVDPSFTTIYVEGI